MSPTAVSEILKRRGIRLTRRRGQNFLIDANLLAKVLEAGDLRPEDAVLEIGAGLGALTRALAARTRRVLAVEVDRGLYDALAEEVLPELPNVRLLHADFLELDLPEAVPRELGPGRHPVVANIPYSITSPVVVRLLENYPLFDRVVLMVQKEVAARLTAAPGTPDYGSLTLFTHVYADVRRVAPVSRRAFLPAPEVDSAIVRLDVLAAPRYADPARYLAVVHAAFRQRRKNLGNALTGPPLNWSREQARGALETSGIDARRRGETLTPDEFERLAEASRSIGACRRGVP
jgi:16S rRNA (adenine1518-N6/adenine1519-N6)-dimethyltransferase